MFLHKHKGNKKVLNSLYAYVPNLSIFLNFSLTPTLVKAADTAVNSTYESGINIDGALQVLTALISVIVLIFLLSLVLKKLNMVPGKNTGLIKIISGLAINNKDRLLLVQVGEEQVLLSVSPGNITKLHQLEKPVSTISPDSNSNNLAEEYSDGEVTSLNENKFSNLLNSVITRNK